MSKISKTLVKKLKHNYMDSLNLYVWRIFLKFKNVQWKKIELQKVYFYLK